MSGDNTPPPTPKIEINSPFFLGPQDRPGDFITPARFNGANYDEWAGEIETALQARRKFGFLDGTITSPEPPCTQSDWTTIHAMLVSWIMNTIAPEVKITLSKYKDAKRLWDNLKERFALVNGPRIQQLKSAIARCEQTKTMTVASYYGKLTALWEELHTHEPLITCSCCNQCSAGRDHETRRANDMLHEFLMGLYTEFYGQIRSNILSQDPLPSLNRAYQLVVQDERVRTASARTEEKPEIVSFAVRTGGRGRGRVERPDKPKSFCTHCKKNGHEITQCFEKIGYPDWWEDRSRTDGGTGRGRQSSTTGRGRTGGNVIHANAAVTSIDGVPGRETLATPSTQLFSEDQWKALASVFGNLTLSNDRLSGKFNGNLWIIDTGASNHVTGNLSLLFDVKNIVCIVGLPDGKKVRAIKEGSVQLSNTITLNHVLYVPRLNCSLLSVSQLCDDLQSRVIFDSQKCAIQDQMRELIGMGSKRDGLYYFKEESLINTVKVDKEISDLVMWHNRMGHPSEKVVKLLAPVRNCRGSLNKACEVCFRAKHPRDSFPLSDSKSSRIFELVHVDLWGPYRHKSSCGARYFLTIVDDFSRAVWVYLLVDKTEVFKMFMSFIAMVERQFSQTIKIVRSDNGTEFNCLLDYFSASGILFQTSCVGTPQQNARVERKHKHLLNVARALRFQAKLPIYFWGESVLAAAHLINRTPSSVLIKRAASKQIVLKEYINGFPKESDMVLKTNSIMKLKVPEGCSDVVLVKNLYLSCDPHMRSCMSKIHDNYIPIFTPGLPINGAGVAKVVDSSNPNFNKDDLIYGMFGWEEYSLVKSNEVLFKIEHTEDVPLSHILGWPGHFPQGIDIYFDNVGGDMLEAALLNINLNGRVVACGMISQYNLSEAQGVRNLFKIVAKQIRMQGFLASQYVHLFPKFHDFILPLIRQGKITYVEDVAQGLESAPAALIGLFYGTNIGKKLVRVASYLVKSNVVLFKIEHTEDVPLSYYIGILGVAWVICLYWYLQDIISKGESVWVSAASGAVGQLLGQFAKLLGCYVIGSAGTRDKVCLMLIQYEIDRFFRHVINI
ncbi:hypothetical protein OROHE_000522 [Orobanche hederae]